MPNEPCDQCPSLRAGINRLTAQNDQLANQLSEARSDIAYTLRLIDAQAEKPTMSLTKLVAAVRSRLASALGGGR